MGKQCQDMERMLLATILSLTLSLSKYIQLKPDFSIWVPSCNSPAWKPAIKDGYMIWKHLKYLTDTNQRRNCIKFTLNSNFTLSVRNISGKIWNCCCRMRCVHADQSSTEKQEQWRKRERSVFNMLMLKQPNWSTQLELPSLREVLIWLFSGSVLEVTNGHGQSEQETLRAVGERIVRSTERNRTFLNKKWKKKLTFPVYVQLWMENSLKQIQIQDNVHVLGCVWRQWIMTLLWQGMLCSAISLVFSCLENCGKCSSGDDYIPAEVWISAKKLTKIYLVILHLHNNWEKGLSSWEGSHACTKANPKRLNMKEQQTKSSSPHTHFSRPLLACMDLNPCQQHHCH